MLGGRPRSLKIHSRGRLCYRFVGEGLIPSRVWESRIQISGCRSGWVREGINGSAELAEVPSPTLESRTPIFGYFPIKGGSYGTHEFWPREADFPQSG